MAVLLLATLDTKGSELGFVRDLLQAASIRTIVADAGAMGTPAIVADIPREQLYERAGTTLAAIQAAGDRGAAITAAALGATRLAVELHRREPLQGILGLGGSAGTTIATAAMRALPYGVPKLVVSTLAGGQVAPYVGVKDVWMLPAIVDISGLNRISRPILANAAYAMIGMVQRAVPLPVVAGDRPLVAATMFGVTTPCVAAARAHLEAAGYEVLVFHATGTGGRTMEALIRDGMFAGVLDLTTTELADELVGGTLAAGPDRLTIAGLCGVPQVISVGALDMVNFGPRASVPDKFAGRRFYEHNATVTLMRTTPEENDALGKEIAHKASAAKGPTAILVPRRGVSAIDREGQPFAWPEADAALFESIRQWLSPDVRHEEYDLHINDPAFARAAAECLLALMGRNGKTPEPPSA